MTFRTLGSDPALEITVVSMSSLFLSTLSFLYPQSAVVQALKDLGL